MCIFLFLDLVIVRISDHRFPSSFIWAWDQQDFSGMLRSILAELSILGDSVQSLVLVGRCVSIRGETRLDELVNNVTRNSLDLGSVVAMVVFTIYFIV